MDNYQEEVMISRACPPSTILDTLGAGDTFCAAVIYALVRKKSLQEALTFGNQIAGAKVGGYGYDGIADIYQQFL